MNELKVFLKNNVRLNDGDTVVIGLSGGPDSMALLDIISKNYTNIKIVCAHVHHNLRKESDKEEKFVFNYCQKNGFIFEFMKIENYTNNKFSEEEARRIRYNFFEQVVINYQAKYLFTAHHGDDLIETILMRLARGSNFKGYSGINLITNKSGYQIVRPLIFLTKDDILRYVEEKNIPYVIDNSNDSLKYTRNRYRTNILPFLKQENKNVHQKFYKYSSLVSDYFDFVNSYVISIYNKVVINNKVNVNLINKEKKIIQKLILEKYIYSIYGDDIICWDDKKTNIILDILKSNKSNIIVDFPNNIKGIKEYSVFYMKEGINKEDFKYKLNDIIELEDGYIKVIDECIEKNNFVTYLNSHDIKLPIYIRNFKIGDKMIVKNMNYEKKIKDIFINEKIPIQKRKTWPIVIDSNDVILWLPGLKKSKFDVQKQEKYDIILKYYYEGR